MTGIYAQVLVSNVFKLPHHHSDHYLLYAFGFCRVNWYERASKRASISLLNSANLSGCQESTIVEITQALMRKQIQSF